MTPTDTVTKPEFSEPDEYGTPPMIDAPAPVDQPPADTKPRRPTTRAGRAAARAAKQAKQASSGDAKPKATTSAPRKATLEKRLTGALVSVGGMVAASSALTGSQAIGADGVLIIEHSENVAKAISRVADENPQVKAALERMLSAGAWSGVVVAVLPIVLGIAANHGAIPPQFAAMLGGAAMPAEPAAA
jgi:hypothetical protein